MSFNDETGQMDWRDEIVWIMISVGSGIVLSFLYSHFRRFPDTKYSVILLICCAAFYILSILLRVQNHRGEGFTGRTAVDETKLKFVFPVVGFAIGIALLLF